MIYKQVIASLKELLFRIGYLHNRVETDSILFSDLSSKFCNCYSTTFFQIEIIVINSNKTLRKSLILKFCSKYRMNCTYNFTSWITFVLNSINVWPVLCWNLLFLTMHLLQYKMIMRTSQRRFDVFVLPLPYLIVRWSMILIS